MPSLWRNGIRLGDLIPPAKFSGDPGAISGVLRPTPAFAGIEPMIQSRMTTLPSAPTFQGVIERQVLEPAHGSGNNPVPRKVAKELQPLSEEEARGVPPEKLLEIRDDDGRTLQCDFISLTCLDVPPDELEEVEKHLGPGTREVWMVMAHRP
jgi:hypothetical protein